MFKRILLVAALGFAGLCSGADKADAGIYFRPVRRVAARAVLPPYPVARRVMPGPVLYQPYVTPVYGTPLYGPVAYGSPYVYGYGSGLSVTVGY